MTSLTGPELFAETAQADEGDSIALGIDPGQTGAVAVLRNGEAVKVFDLPVMPRKASGLEINGAELASLLRGVLQEAGAARVRAYVEQVNAMPSIPGPDGVRRGMGSSSAFRFGESFGVLKGVLAALGIRYELIAPQTWKKSQGLTGSEKDYARTVATREFPEFAGQLARKKDIGRADALLIAKHGANR